MNDDAKPHLNAQDQKRLAALEDIRDQLVAGKHVQNRRLQSWLTSEEFAQISAGWAEEKEQRLDPADKPKVVLEYEQLLRRAHFLYNKAEKASQVGNKISKKLYPQSDSAYEEVLEYLVGHYEIDPTLQIWFDRPLNWSMTGTIKNDFHGMPRVVTSRSLENMSNGTASGTKQSKRDIKLAVVKKAIDALRNQQPEKTEAEINQANDALKSMLKKLKAR